MSWHNAYAAQIDENNVVRQVIVIPHCNDDDEQITAFCNSIGLPGKWIDTSFTGSRRQQFAAVGHKYNPDIDAFEAA